MMPKEKRKFIEDPELGSIELICDDMTQEDKDRIEKDIEESLKGLPTYRDDKRDKS